LSSALSSKGQVTAPVQVRDQLGLSAGTEIEFVIRDGEAVLRKGGATHPVDRIYGRLQLGKRWTPWSTPCGRVSDPADPAGASRTR